MKEQRALRLSVLGVCAVGCIVLLCATLKNNDRPLTDDGGTNVMRQQYTQEEAKAVVSSIHENMTFAEIAKILPLSTNCLHYTEHGGISYIVRLGKFSVVLRFEYPGGRSYSTNAASPDSVLNLAPFLQ